jgi:hypothetical protein
VYYAISYIPSRHLQKIKSWSIILYVCYVSLWISTKDEEQDPPSLYWISYVHICVPFKQCYIAMPVKCSTKLLSELLTSNSIGRVTFRILSFASVGLVYMRLHNTQFLYRTVLCNVIYTPKKTLSAWTYLIVVEVKHLVLLKIDVARSLIDALNWFKILICLNDLTALIDNGLKW